MKIKKTRSIQQIIDDQVNKWKVVSTERAKEKTAVPVITISRQLGSEGQLVAKRLAEGLLPILTFTSHDNFSIDVTRPTGAGWV
ncbi:MAG: hypothetical protein V2A69_14730 [Pseudomonadota bacterium]